MNDPSNQQQQQYPLQQSVFHINGGGAMGMVIPQHQQTNQLSTTHFATTSSSETAGNGEFNSAGNQSQNNQNFINLESGLGQVQQMSSFVDRSGGNVHIQDHNINMQHINSFALSQSQGSNMPNLFAPHLLQNQTQLLSVHNQFRQDNVNDWRNALSFQDRNHVVRQFGVAVQNALPPPHQNATKVENLAKGLEQHIYESAESRANYMEKIKDQLNNIERKVSATEVRHSNSPAVENSQPRSNSQPVVGNHLEFNTSTSGDLLNNQNSNTNEKGSRLDNSLGLDVSGMQNSMVPQNQNVTSDNNGNNLQNMNDNSNISPEANSSGPGTLNARNVIVSNSGDANGNSSKSSDSLNQATTFSESQVNGMKVTLLDLQDSEKDAVRAKMEQIRPTYLRIDALISTLLKHGGDREFDKVRKLTGMKQMLQAQFEVLHQNIFFIRPETLQQLLPSLNQYFGYAELIGNRSGGNTPILRGNQPSPPMLGHVNTQQPRAQSPMIHPNVLNSQTNFGRQGVNNSIMNNSSSMSQNMLMGQQQMPIANQMHNMPIHSGIISSQQIQQQIQILQTKLMHLQQQLQQTHQMSMGPVGADQLHNIQMKQQELLRVQQVMTQQLNQWNQMHRVSLAQQRNLNTTPRPNMNQIQNPLMGNQIRHMTPQVFAQRQAQQMTQQQFNVFQGQSRPFLQTTSQKAQFQPVLNNNSHILARTQTPSSYPSDFHDSPKMTSSQVGTPQAVNSPADTTASAQVGPKIPPKQISIDKSSPITSKMNINSSPKPTASQNQILISPSSNQQSPAQNLYISTPKVNQNQPIGPLQSSLNVQATHCQPQVSYTLIKEDNTDTKKGSKDNVEGQWSDDPFNFGVDPLSAGLVGENKDEENVEDFFNWDYEPPGKNESANQHGEDQLDFLEPAVDTGSHENSPATQEGDATLNESGENAAGPSINPIKRNREEDFVDEQNPKKTKDYQVDLVQELSQLATDYSITCNILPNTPSSHIDHCKICCTFGSISFTITLIDRSAYESGNFSIQKEFSSTYIPSTLVADLLEPSSSSKLADFIERIVQK